MATFIFQIQRRRMRKMEIERKWKLRENRNCVHGMLKKLIAGHVESLHWWTTRPSEIPSSDTFTEPLGVERNYISKEKIVWMKCISNFKVSLHNFNSFCMKICYFFAFYTYMCTKVSWNPQKNSSIKISPHRKCSILMNFMSSN